LSPVLGRAERIARTERVISFIRSGVVTFNVTAYLWLAPTDATRRSLALSVSVLAVIYTAAMLAWRPQQERQTIAAATTGTVVDNLLIGIWIYTTGGFESPFFPVFYAEAAATVGRFGFLTGALSGGASAVIYLIVVAIDGEIPGYPMLVRIGYIAVIVAFVGYVVEVARRSERDAATAEAEAQALREVDELRSIFVTNISHELRTPLTAIRGAAVTLNDKVGGLDVEEERTLVEMIDRQSERLSRLVDDIVDVGLLERDQIRMNKDLTEAVALARSVVEEMAAVVAQPVSLESDAEGIPLVCDAPKIANALRKLIDNAAKFSPPGTAIRVSIHEGSDDVCIFVIDGGIGIAPEHQEKVFDNFYQVDPSHTRAAEGTGVGLTIARSLVRLHGGDINVESQLGHGSTFGLRIPKTGSTADQRLAPRLKRA
jgi:signal transduction histidine kinase